MMYATNFPQNAYGRRLRMTLQKQRIFGNIGAILTVTDFVAMSHKTAVITFGLILK